MEKRTRPSVTIERLGSGGGGRLRAIRLRALADAPDAFGATLEAAAARPPADWEQHLNDLTTFVATENNGDVGLVRCTRHDGSTDTGYLISMWVAPEARRGGIGSSLVDAVVAWARAQGLSRVVLDVVETNAAALELYSRNGFVPNGEVGSLPPPREHIREIQLVRQL